MKWTYGLLLLAALAAGIGLGRYAFPARPDEASIVALRQALRGQDWPRRARVLSRYLENLDAEKLPEALEVIESRRRWLSQDELRLVMIAWARFDPAGAFARTLSWPDHAKKKGAAAAIYAWALRDPKAAYDALMGQTDIALQELLKERWMAAWSHGADKAGASRYIAALPPGARRDRFTTVLARDFMALGPDALMSWVEGLPADARGRFKANAFEKAAGVLAQDAPEVAAAWVEGDFGLPWANLGAAAVARRWAERDPTAALAWLEGLPAGARRDRAVNVGFRQWHQRSPIAAEAWLKAEDGVAALDPARELVVRRKAATSPSAAIALASSIRQAASRERAIVGAVRIWLQSDPAAAQAWLDASPLSAAAKQQALLPAKPGPRQHRKHRAQPRKAVELDIPRG